MFRFLLFPLVLFACAESSPPEGATLTHAICFDEEFSCDGPMFCLDPYTHDPLVDQLGMPAVPMCLPEGAGCWGALTDTEEGLVHVGDIFVWCMR